MGGLPTLPKKNVDYEDKFSHQAAEYARFRPTYPPELYAYLAEKAPAQRLAWDCGTGSGQAALGLADHFWQVAASDATPEQIAHAYPHPRIHYFIARVEQVGLPDHSVDLIAAAQAIHWFDLPAFYAQARRVLKPGGVVAAWCYYLPQVSPAVDELMAYYFNTIVGPYWSPLVQRVVEGYRTIPFPFDELQPPQFVGKTHWSLAELFGYLESWSSTQRYKEIEGSDPLEVIRRDLSAAWSDGRAKRLVRWPLYTRMGRVSRPESQNSL
jgi:SAM-dependent methyltransferase